ncbi:MAG: ATP synthase F0 subunit C [Myxococcales bacterium]|nr:ATP synthase F0 subunit C [Myxococcales bacterium]
MRIKITTGFWAAVAAVLTLLGSAVAHAESMDPLQAEQNKWFALAAALGIGIAAAGGAVGQGRAAAAALDGIARNPGASDKLFTPMILGLALIESLVIYALLISLLLYGKM